MPATIVAGGKIVDIAGMPVGRRGYQRIGASAIVVDPGGKVVYAGAIDDKWSTNPADAKTAHNYVRAALTEAMSGKPVTVASTTPYGCSIKY